jgi:hypothetical protein
VKAENQLDFETLLSTHCQYRFVGVGMEIACCVVGLPRTLFLSEQM